MASSWIGGMIANGVSTAIQPAVASGGSFVGGAVASVGSGINGIGESINSYVRSYGTGVQDYGNGIRDWTAADGSRAQTATNPLGLSSNSVGGKYAVTNPSRPPVYKKSNSVPPAAPQKKAIGAGKSQKAITASPAKKPAAPKSSTTTGGKVRVSPASRPQPAAKKQAGAPAAAKPKPAPPGAGGKKVDFTRLG